MARFFSLHVAVVSLAAVPVHVSAEIQQLASTYHVDDSNGPGPAFDGIGGLSGGGCTTVLLPSYPEPFRSDILDYLFKPNWGASLHTLKVEIGSSAQSTDGSEATHMQSPTDLDYGRGYEWWLMVEAKKRSPAIDLYGLAWGWPQWVSCSPDAPMTNCSDSPYTWPEQTAGYIIKWIEGANSTYNLPIDFIGSWNERSYDATYLKTLRRALDASGFDNTRIVAADSDWQIADDILSDPDLAAAVDVIGAHYPGTGSTPQAKATGKKLWASEDMSTYANNVGAGCWARVINQNYVNGNMTASISWNLIASYMKGTNWYEASLMVALQPWSGTYTVSPLIWVTAHTTQFSQPGWRYLLNGTGTGTGSGRLAAGGSYVTLQSPDGGDVSIVIEKMSHDASPCVRPDLPWFDTANEAATFTLGGSLAAVTKLYVWHTHFAFGPGDVQREFEQLAPISVVGGSFTLNVTVNSMYTLTTLPTGRKGQASTPIPPPAMFPSVHTDDYDACPSSSEAAYVSDQNGSFECQEDSDEAHGMIMRQVTPLRPITWGGDVRPHALIGNRDFVNVSYYHDVKLNADGEGALLGVRGAGTDDTAAALWAFDATGHWNITALMSDVTAGVTPLASGTLPVAGFGVGQWHTFRMDANGSLISGWVDGIPVFAGLDVSGRVGRSGHVVMGAVSYGQYPSFDNLAIFSTITRCGGSPLVAGAPVSLVECATEVGPSASSAWDFKPLAAGSIVGTFSLRNVTGLCMTVVPQPAPQEAWPVSLAPCNAGDVNQQWAQNYTQLYQSTISNPASGHCLDIFNAQPDIGAAIDAWPCHGQSWFYDYLPGAIMDINSVTCLGVC